MRAKRDQTERELRESEKRVRRKLDAVLSPEADIGVLELSDIIDSEKLQVLMNEFYGLTRIGIGIIDLRGRVLVGTGWQDICTKFHRINPESCRLCIESDLELSHNVPAGTFKLYRCKNNMWDMATPIMLGDKHVGNIFLGQFLFDDETPDYEIFRQQARRYGFDEQEYLAALDRIPRWNRQTVNAAMSFYSVFAGVIGNLSYSNIKLVYALEARKRAEEELHRLNRELRAISLCNQAVVRTQNEQDLLNEICRIICDEAGYRMAWVGYAEHDHEKTVRPVAWSGFEDGYVANAKLSWADDAKRAQGPGGVAIRSGKTVYIDDFTTDPRVAPWRESALQRGYHSTIAMPLKDDNGSVFGALLIYSTKINAFTPYEIRILEELAGDLAFGITALRMRAKRDQTERELRESEERYRLIAENTADTIAVFDLNLRSKYISPSTLRLRGFTVQESMSQTLDQILTPDSLQQARKLLNDQLALESSGTADPARTALIELEEYCKDGSTIWVELAVSFIRDNLNKPIGILTVTRNITERRKAEERLQQTLESLKKAVGTTIQVLVSALESRDPYTAGHQVRVAHLACAIAGEMGIDQEKVDGIRMAGSIHDIGKLSVPSEILTKPTKLSNLEFSLIKEHPQSGYEMLKYVESPWPLAEIIYQHHERMNGTGYPRNMKGDEILMESRILAVADVVEAMGSHRPYRASMGIDAALEEIEKNKGILYDNVVVDTCLRLFREKGYQLI
jgi:PAS domain S-box-containing protein/putative nucleotidyltransferase with HDIG domain